MTYDSTLRVLIPGSSASRSKMQKKGWKCWAKLLTGVRSPAKTGYDYEGEFLGVETHLELQAGDVLLHVDDGGESGIGIVMPKVTPAGEGWISWRSTASGSWAGTLGRPARQWLAMTAEERVRAVAGDRLDDAEARAKMSPAAVAFWQRIAGREPSAEVEVVAGETEPTTPDLTKIVAQIELLLAPLTAAERAEVYGRLPGVEHTT